jgi:serine/threonine protein kinase
MPLTAAVSATAVESIRVARGANRGSQGVAIAVGETVGDYVIEEPLGHGTEGEVFLARDILLGRRVALKTLRSTSAEATHCVEEARLMAGLEHPNIVRVYHAQRHAGVWLVVFEHIAGGSLHSQVERAGPMPAARALELMAQAAAGLGYAHELGILHRDVKPQNLLLNHRAEVKLADFGLALDIRGAGGARAPAVGTPAFLPPELWSGGNHTPASDIYSLGCCLYFVLTGRVPFPFSTREQLEQAHLELTPKLPADLPGGVQQALLAMLAKDPALRPQSASQLARDLSTLARDPGGQIRVPLKLRPRPPESPLLAGGSELGLAAALSQGPDRVYFERSLELLQAGPCALAFRALPSLEAQSLLRVALERCAPPQRVSLRLSLPTPATPFSELLRQKTSLPPDSPLARVCHQLGLEEPGPASPACVVEVHAAFPLSERQSAELSEFARAASAHEISTVLFVPADAAGAGSPASFETLSLPGPRLAPREFNERVRLWMAAATGGRWDVSADGLRLLRHCCSEQGHFWPRLTQDSLLISAAARLPLVTSWAVQAAQSRALPLHAPCDVPVEWRAAPRRWPSPQMQELLSTIRSAELLEAAGAG